MSVRRLVIDVLIPHDPSEIMYAERVSELKGVEGVTVHLMEIDERTKTLEVTIEGEALSFEDIKKAIEELGGAVHSIDRVSAGTRIMASRAEGEEKG